MFQIPFCGGLGCCLIKHWCLWHGGCGSLLSIPLQWRRQTALELLDQLKAHHPACSHSRLPLLSHCSTLCPVLDAQELLCAA
jgi:hypothetical protein